MAELSADNTTTVQGQPERGWTAVAHYTVGSLFGGGLGGLFVIGVTTLIKVLLAVVSRQATWVIIALPVAAIAATTAVLHGIGQGEAAQRLRPAPPIRRMSRRRRSRRWSFPRLLLAWRTFPADVARADLTGDVVASAGAEERFPWRQAPLRTLAILITVGLGAPMGTEAPAAHLGVASGAWLGQLRPAWRPYLRGAAVAGGAAAVSALMGVSLVGTAFILELGRRRRVPLSAPRVIAALLGGFIGWLLNKWWHLNLIRLIKPTVAPTGLFQLIESGIYVGVIAGVLTALTG